MGGRGSISDYEGEQSKKTVTSSYNQTLEHNINHNIFIRIICLLIGLKKCG